MLGARLSKLKEIPSGFLANPVRKRAACILKLSAIKMLARLARSRASAPVRHRGREKTTVNGGVAGCARLVSHKLRAHSAGGNRKQKCQWKNQRVEYIIADGNR